MSQAWLIIERVENWEVDSANGFAFFGLSNRYSKIVAQIAEGDIVFCYVSSGLSALSDIRIVQEKGLKALKNQAYDSAFPYYLSTKPVLSLARKNWVPFKSVALNLDLTRGKSDYRNLFRTSIRKLTEHDAQYLDATLRGAVPKT